MQTNVTVVILAAGLGTRMRSKRAKVLHRAGGLTLIEHVVKTALRLTSPDRIFVVVGHQADEVRSTVAHAGVQFIEQKEQRGTGHAVIAGRDRLAGLDGLLAVLYGDCPLVPEATLRALIEAQKSSTAAATITTSMLPDPTGYGRVLRDAKGHVIGVVEQKAATPEQLAIREGNVGIYCYRADLFWKHAGEIQPNNPVNEYYLTDMVEIFVRSGYSVDALMVDDPAPLLGINNRLELAAADHKFRERKTRELMLEGVTIEKPETVTVDDAVRVGPDTVIEPFARILGNTVIGEGCHIGTSAIIEDSELADNVVIGPFTIVGTSKLAPGVQAGPYARLRMGNQVDAGAHIGNFVELKKTHLGAGAKAMHLAYLGDSDVGEKVNVGAGTITCNYDGVHKHATRIGKGVFVGSNSTLVAPLEIADGAYLAAGSVITDTVPPDALALGRARQTIKPDWAKRRREKTGK